MLHGSAPRSAHRAAPEGGLTVLVMSLGQESAPTGQHRQPSPPRRGVREPQRTMQMLTSGLGAVILLAICGLIGFVIVADERRGNEAEAVGKVGGTDRILDTRASDAAPLTLDEVFPEPELRLMAGADPYRIAVTNVDSECGYAAVGNLRSVLQEHSCSQVVRASMTAPYGGYQVTAGIFNLADQDGAAEVGEQARQLVESGHGTFAAMAVGGPQPLSQVGWHERGHFLVYCVISRPDGQVVLDRDPYAQRITVDLVESYLYERIIGKRSLDP